MAVPNAKDGSRGSILAKLGFVTQKSALFPLLCSPKFYVQSFVGAFSCHCCYEASGPTLSMMQENPCPNFDYILKLL